MKALKAVLLCALVLAALGCSRDDACQDADGDGYGAGCRAGSDCDDGDPSRVVACDGGVEPDCDETPRALGCPCLAGQRPHCYDAPAHTMDVGACRGGRARCEAGRFAECEGAVLPQLERCNDEDDDCDGLIDEGVQSPCGGCDPTCIGGVWGPPLAPFSADGDLALTAASELTLRRVQARDAMRVFVPNTDEGTVSMVDAELVLELARYRTPGAPVRVAVDGRGDAYVLDGRPAQPAVITKLAGERERCIDRQGDGLATSQGPRDVRALGDDECVIASFPVASASEDAQALIVDGTRAPDRELAGHVWVGLAGSHELVHFDGESFARLRSIALPEFAPHAGEVDAWGVLWLIDRRGLLARVDPASSPAAVEIISVPLACYALDSLALSPDGRVVLGAASCESVIVFDPARKSFSESLLPDFRTPREIVADGERAWIALASGELGSARLDALTHAPPFSLALGDIVPVETYALSADAAGALWAVSTLGASEGRGVLTRFDPESEQVTAQLPVGVGPRGVGDLTGHARSFDFARQAVARHVFQGCGHTRVERDAGLTRPSTEWRTLRIAAVAGGGGSVEMSARWAPDADALEAAAFTPLGVFPASTDVLPLSFPSGGVLEVQLRLRSEFATGAPRIARVGVEWQCPGPD